MKLRARVLTSSVLGVHALVLNASVSDVEIKQKVITATLVHKLGLLNCPLVV